MSIDIKAIKKKVGFDGILVAPSMIDFSNPIIQERYQAILNTDSVKIGGITQFDDADKRRLIAHRETGRLRNEAITKEIEEMEGDRMLDLLEAAKERKLERMKAEGSVPPNMGIAAGGSL